MGTPNDNQQRVTVDLVLGQLRKCNFAVLSTVSEEGRSHSAGVNYGVSRPGRGFAIYVMTRRHLQKARNIAMDPQVSLVVPVTRRLLWFLPPPTVQLHGRAEILDWTDEDGTDVFRRFWMGRRILDAYQRSHRRGETRICFLKITPDPVIRTYMLGFSAWELRRRMESGAAKMIIPPHYRDFNTSSRWTTEGEAMDAVKMSLCPACTACPEVEIRGGEVRIGERGNMVVLEKEEWNVLVELVRSGQLGAV